MNKLALPARLLLGGIFFVFGLNGFFQFIPIPAAPEAATQFIMSLINTGYLMKIVKIVEIIGGALLLAGVFVPLALLILTPIILNIFWYDLFLNPSALPMSALLVVLALFLSHIHREVYLPLFKMK